MNQYNNIKLLGKGSYGTVYKVQKKDNKKIYALKELDTSKLKTKYDIKSLINELKILCYHDSDYLLKCKDIFYEKKKINIITDYAKYIDLSNLIEKNKNRKTKLNEKIIWLIFIKCCYGLEYLHNYNIIHRDLKTANILLSDNGSVWLADFGVSKILENKISSFTMIGTPYYVSPEMFSDKNYDKKIDIWALGCILYELATLNVPFKANDMKSLKNKILSGRYYEESLYNYSLDLKNMIRYLLEKNNKIRPSINEVINSRIFKRKEHEYNLSNKSKFSNSINIRFHDDLKIPKRTKSWNNLIINIDENNKNKIIDNKIELEKIELEKIELENEKIIEDEKKKLLNEYIKHNNYKVQEKLRKKSLEKNLKEEYNNKNKENNNKYYLPKLNELKSNKEKIYELKSNKEEIYDLRNKYEINNEYNFIRYKNKYKRDYNIINNTKLPELKYKNNYNYQYNLPKMNYYNNNKNYNYYNDKNYYFKNNLPKINKF